jgi:hypothetical protein
MSFSKLSHSVLLLSLLTATLFADVTVEEPRLITQKEAEEIISAREEAQKKHRAEIRALIDSALVDEEFVHNNGKRKVILRRVKPVGAFVAKAKGVSAKGRAAVSHDLRAFEPVEYRMEHISMYTVVYNHSHSEITWRDSEDGQSFEYTIWTNVPLTYLRPLTSFEAEDVHYSYMGFVDLVDSKWEQERADNYSFHGHKYKSRWKDSPVTFSNVPEYVVVADDPSAVPAKLFEQMDSLIGYYLEQENSLRIQHENAETMNTAMKKYRDENPETPTDRVMIMWPEKNSRYLK